MTPMITHGGNITVNPLGVPSIFFFLFSATITKSLAKNVYQKYTLGVHQLNHDAIIKRIRFNKKLQKNKR